MNKVWVGVFFVVLFAVLLATGLTVAFVFRDGKKDDKEKKDKEAKPTSPESGKSFSLVLHLSDSEVQLKGREKVWTLDLTKTADYDVSGTHVKLSDKKNSFHEDKRELLGKAHKFHEPVVVTKFESEKTVEPKDYVELSGLTVWFRDDEPYFYSLWHDGDYHHYTPQLLELSVGDFPYSNDDTKKPKDLELPEGVVKKREEPVPSEPSAEVEPKKDDREELLKKVTADLDLLATFTQEKNKYKSAEKDVEVEKKEFGKFTLWVFKLSDGSEFPPVLKYEDEVLQLPTTVGTKELLAYSDSQGLPLLVSYKDAEVEWIWVHRGSHRWDKRDQLVVNNEVLTEVYSSLLQLVSLDFAVLEDYTSGSYKVKVREDKTRFLADEFVCYTHEPTYALPGETQREHKVFRFRSRGVLLEGLPENAHVLKATACFWRGNLTRPLGLVLAFKDKTTYHYGFPKLTEEPNEHKLEKRLELVNLLVNRAVKFDFTKSENYIHTLDRRSLEPHYVSVTTHLNTPKKGFTKVVHKFFLDNKESKFHVAGFKGAVVDTQGLEFSSLAAYFVASEKELPVLVKLVGVQENVFELVHVKEGDFVTYTFSRERPTRLDLEEYLEFLAHKVYKYVTLDLLKVEDYKFNGSDYAREDTGSTLKVVVEENSPRPSFKKVTQKLQERGGVDVPLKVLYLRGGDFKAPTGLFTKVESFFSDRHMNSPLAVTFTGPNGFSTFVWSPLGFKEVDYKVDLMTAHTLEITAWFRFRSLTLQLSSKSDYYLETPAQSLTPKVTVKPLKEDGYLDKFEHTFPPTKDISFQCGSHYYLPKGLDKFPNNFTSAVVLHSGENRFVTLYDAKNEHKSWQFVDGKWSEATAVDVPQFSLRSRPH